jgi:hypothetical protein
MSFFEDLPEPPQMDPPPRPKRQPWMGAPAGWIGGWVPWHIELFKTEKLFAVIGDVYAFPTGVSFAVENRRRPVPIERGQRDISHLVDMGLGPKIGIGFSDGRKTHTAAQRPHELTEDPIGPVLQFCGGGSGNGGGRVNLWLWPLPPPGPLTIAAVWPDEDVSERILTLDAEELIEAAGRAEKLWVIDPNHP